jgi:hypothetical protein
MTTNIENKSEEIKQIIDVVLNLLPDNGTYIHDIKWSHNTYINTQREDDNYLVRLYDENYLAISIHEIELISERLSKIGLRLVRFLLEGSSKIFEDNNEKKFLILDITSYDGPCGCFVCKELGKN